MRKNILSPQEFDLLRESYTNEVGSVKNPTKGLLESFVNLQALKLSHLPVTIQRALDYVMFENYATYIAENNPEEVESATPIPESEMILNGIKEIITRLHNLEGQVGLQGAKVSEVLQMLHGEVSPEIPKQERHPHKSRYNKQWTPEEEQYLVEHSGNKTATLASKLHRTKSAIENKKSELRRMGKI